MFVLFLRYATQSLPSLSTGFPGYFPLYMRSRIIKTHSQSPNTEPSIPPTSNHPHPTHHLEFVAGVSTFTMEHSTVTPGSPAGSVQIRFQLGPGLTAGLAVLCAVGTGGNHTIVYCILFLCTCHIGLSGLNTDFHRKPTDLSPAPRTTLLLPSAHGYLDLRPNISNSSISPAQQTELNPHYQQPHSYTQDTSTGAEFTSPIQMLMYQPRSRCRVLINLSARFNDDWKIFCR